MNKWSQLIYGIIMKGEGQIMLNYHKNSLDLSGGTGITYPSLFAGLQIDCCYETSQ